MNAEAKILALRREPPPAPKPVAVYRPLVVVDNIAYVPGLGPLKSDLSLLTGRVGANLDLASGPRVIKLLGMVNCTAEFPDQPRGSNGFSELFADVTRESPRFAMAGI